MRPAADTILNDLRAVERLRSQRATDHELASRVTAVKRYQARRFERTYSDLLKDERYRRAARFFLEELYGPQEFVDRDAQFSRIVPSLTRLFPNEIVETVAALARLHALSETLDTRMAGFLPNAHVDASTYVRIWRCCGHFDSRRQQIELTLKIGAALVRYTRSAWFRRILRLMRKPAIAAGLAELQRFLEQGFETFGAMTSAPEFLFIVRQREIQLSDALCVASSEATRKRQDLPSIACDDSSCTGVLEQLPS